MCPLEEQLAPTLYPAEEWPLATMRTTEYHPEEIAHHTRQGSRLNPMEAFHLYDPSSITYNKNIERIISPMVVQLCHLIISIERSNVKNEVFAGLGAMAEKLAKASEQLAHLARRLAGESDEELLKAEMVPAAEFLLLSGKNILLVAQELHIHPDNQYHKEELIITAQKILVGTVKILLIEDDAMMRKIIQAACWCLNCLDTLEVAGDVFAVLAFFQNFSEGLLFLNTLTERRLLELKWSVHRDCLAQCLQFLKKCIPLLYTATSGNLSHPQNQQVRESKRYIFYLTKKTLEELIALLNAQREPQKDPQERSGALSQHLEQLLMLLAEPILESVLQGDLDSLLGAMVFHSMLLAESSRPHMKLKLVQCCHCLLELRCMVVQCLSRMEILSSVDCSNQDLREKQAMLRCEVQILDQTMQTGLLYEILDTFTDVQGPLKRLIQVAWGITVLGSSWDSERFAKSLQPFTDAFCMHSEKMFKVAHLVLVRCTQHHIGKEIGETMSSMRKLMVRVLPLCTKSQERLDLAWLSDAFQDVYQAWVWAAEGLLACFDNVFNIPEFLTVSIEEMAEHMGFSELSLNSGNSKEFSWHVAYLQGRAKHIIQVMNRYVDQNRDPIFRNGLRVLIQQLENSIPTVTVAAERCLENRHDTQTKDVFLKKVKLLIDFTHGVQDGLDGTNHPDILSPLRDQIHKFITPKEQLRLTPHSLLEFSSLEPLGKLIGGLSVVEEFSNTSHDSEEYHSRDIPTLSLMVPKIIRQGIPLPVISKLVLAVESHDPVAVSSACTELLDLANCTEAAQEALVGGKSSESEGIIQTQDFISLTPYTVGLAKEIANKSASCTGRLLGAALQLSEKIAETHQNLAAIAGDWYHLSQQLFCGIEIADLPRNVQIFSEVRQNIMDVVQLADKTGQMHLNKELSLSIQDPEQLLQIQAKLQKVETHAQYLLDKVLDSNGLQCPKTGDTSIKESCLLWSVAVQALLRGIDGFIGRDILFLTELRQVMKDNLGLQGGLAPLASTSLRLQEAAKLSALLCGDEGVKEEVVLLQGEVHVLTEALLEVAQILALSPPLVPNLSIRFELLQRELALQAKILAAYLSSINKDYERIIQDTIQLALSASSASKDDKTKFKVALGKNVTQITSSIQTVQKAVEEGLESGPGQESLLRIMEHLILLTAEVGQKAHMLLEHPQDKVVGTLESLQWAWAAEAHYVAAQFQMQRGSHASALQLLALDLQTSGESVGIASEDPDLPLPSQGESLTATEVDNTACQVTSSRGISDPADSEESCPGLKDAAASAVSRKNLGKVASKSHGVPPCSASSAPDLDHSFLRDDVMDKWRDNSNRIEQLTREMATEVFHMARSLKRKGPITTKDQLIASAKKTATCGHMFVKFIRLIAKNCLDQRCADDLLCVLEQIQTMSNQLNIISSVKSALASSKSSEELLVNNAQNLLQGVLQTLKAAEAACLRGLREPILDADELEAAAFCLQWKRELIKHRSQEASNADRDESGLRKTKAKKTPTLVSMVQEQWTT
ncbi:uncharacterized protein [Petaurus breviceps papuanus]|uniref:uncharacterized protein n=1 Tax=Petaurus breviceps papuanus TaxID=3040969 RepID=UPI0036DDC606